MAMGRPRWPEPSADTPLHLCQVLEEEDAALNGPLDPAPTWLLTPEQVDAEGLVAALRGPSAVAAYLRGRLPEPTRQAVLVPGAPAAALLPDLLRALNGLLTCGVPLYDPETVPVPAVGEELRGLYAIPLVGDALVHVNRLFLDRAFPDQIVSVHDHRLRALYRRVHARAAGDGGGPPRTALCLSGGGIRSATFGLGVVQGLARLGLLERFDFLSTVSGGGYLGGWLTGWIHRHPAGAPGISAELAQPSPAARSRSPLDPEPRPVAHLREYSNYLSPRLGLLSADTWTLAATYLRNLLLNWVVLIPLLLGVLAVPRLGIAILLMDPGGAWRTVALGVGLVGMVLSVVFIGVYRPGLDGARRRLSPGLRGTPSQRRFLLLGLVPLLLSACSLTVYWAWLSNSSATLESHMVLRPVWLNFVVTGAVLHAVAWAVGTFVLRHGTAAELVIDAATGALAGLLVWLAASEILPEAPVGQFVEYYVTVAVPVFIAAFLLAATLFVGLVSWWTNDEDREWFARVGAWALVAGVAWLVVSALVVLGPLALLYSTRIAVSSLTIGGVAGALSVLFGRSARTAAGEGGTGSRVMELATVVAAPLAVAAIVILLSLLTTAIMTPETACREWPVVTPPIPLPPDPVRHLEVLHCMTPGHVATWIAALLAGALVMSLFIDVNRFSLHAMYRARLIRAYLGASRDRRQPNPFTGFDPLDDLQMHELRDEAFNLGSFQDLDAFVRRLQEAAADGPADPVSVTLLRCLDDATRDLLLEHAPEAPVSSTLQRALLDGLNRVVDETDLAAEPAFSGFTGAANAIAWRGPGIDVRARRNRALLDAAYAGQVRPQPPPPRKPLHVINMALNLVAGRRLAWQERKAETFTVTELHAGSYHLGYRRARDYASSPGRRGISLGTAVAISGAAASPNMGYHSSSLVAFLLTMFNVRLGWWLGNPGVAGQETYRVGTPLFGIMPIVKEAFGLTDDTYPYVYLSDGGHFDNLGLLEMVLRRCHLIVVSDASCDPGCALDDLGNAIRKVRTDLSVPIELVHPLGIASRARKDRKEPGQHGAVCRIKYSEVDPGGVDGWLIYLKPSYYGGEPVDVYNYAQAHELFPHESTGDQFFAESQFESYRRLGLYTVETVLGTPSGPLALTQVVEIARRHAGRDGATPPVPTAGTGVGLGVD
jgi:hypothetical protein